MWQTISSLAQPMLKPEIVFYFTVLMMAFILFLLNRLPSVHAWTDFMNMLNTKGGNIFVLTIFTFWSLSMSVKYLYYCLSLVQGGKLTPDNALANFGLSMMFGTITGGFMGALIKTMTGEALGQLQTPIKPSGDTPPTPEPKPPVAANGAE